MMGAILIIHRYLGVLVGLVMTVWCLSGFVMMYQAYPETTPEERLAGLQPLDLSACCQTGQLDTARQYESIRVEMMAGGPVARATPADSPAIILDLSTGLPTEGIGPELAARIAAQHAQSLGLTQTPRLDTLVRDQWTVQLARRHQPIYRASFGDPAATQIYVSGATGEVIQDTTRRERILGWLGAVPHWLYPAVLRQHSGTWIQVVIWSSVLGVFLTVTGVYVGVSRWLARPKGRISPFRGLWLWHHMIGLVFGVLTLTWTLSGLFSMSPWGLFEGQGGRFALAYQGQTSGADIAKTLAAVPAMKLDGAVQLEAVPVGGALGLIVTDAGSNARRLSPVGADMPLGGAEIATALGGVGAPLASLERLGREDAYYYGHHGEVDLPVWRAVLGDAGATRLYIDTVSGQVRRVADPAARQYRWWQSGLHDFDFPVLRERPLWDIVVLLLLAGVTGVCATGTWLSWRRLKLDFRRLTRGRGRQPPLKT